MSVLADLVAAVRAGESRVLVVRGEAGVGKTALLDYLAGEAQGCRVMHAAGVQSEMEFAFAGLHQLLAPMLDRVERLPGPQRDALGTVFGISAGPAPDRFLVALAVLSLLSEVAGERPLVCVIDDQQWLDGASAQALGFVARRLAAEPVGLLFGVRVPGAELAGLPELAVEGLAEDDARALLDSALTGPLDDRVRDQIIAEAEGNPLALLELPLVLLAPRESKITEAGQLWRQDKITETLICLPPDEIVSRHFQQGLAKLGVDWIPGIETSAVDLIATYVAGGFGLGVWVAIPQMSFPPQTRPILLADFPPVVVGALWRGKPNPVLRACLDEFQSRARALKNKGQGASA